MNLTSAEGAEESPGIHFERMNDLFMADQLYSKKLQSLDIFGHIKQVSPSEYFITKDNKLMTIDKDSETKTYGAKFADLNIPNVQGRAHLWIPDE